MGKPGLTLRPWAVAGARPARDRAARTGSCVPRNLRLFLIGLCETFLTKMRGGTWKAVPPTRWGRSRSGWRTTADGLQRWSTKAQLPAYSRSLRSFSTKLQPSSVARLRDRAAAGTNSIPGLTRRVELGRLRLTA